MRPVSLTMKAFGSFAKKTEVPFSDFARGLYLVVGETGAGKTTIFDAIVFALFGAASGTNRKPDMMHSDYVEKSEDTEVCLVFDHNGKRYTVTRTIHFTKKRGTENEYGDGKLSADLILPEGRAVSGHAAVTRRCEELLGLNADQFRKIVMLAQGEFREFLAADSGKKSEILGKLFDSSAYVRYQTLLGSARAALDAKRKQYRESVDAVMRTTFRMPEEEDDSFLYHASNPQLIDNLDRLIVRDTERATELAERKAAAQKAVDEINTRKGAAESNNQKLDELFAAREHDEKLNAQRGDMETLTEQCARAQKALHKVCPARDKNAAAAVAVERARAELAALRAKEAELRDGCETTRANVEGDADAKARVIEIDASVIEPVATVKYKPDQVKTVRELEGTKVDQVYIGSCTNGRIEDLRVAAQIVRGKKIADGIRAILAPATPLVYRQALKEGLIADFIESGFCVTNPTCGACLGMSNGVLANGEVCASTTNRNFNGRMGKGGTVHLMSPATAAATALAGHIANSELFKG